MTRTSAALALALLPAACGDDGAPPPDDTCGSASGATVEVGEGGSRLRPLPASGGSLEIVRGAQGGIHVLVGFRTVGLPLEMDIAYELRDPSTGARVGEALTELHLRPGHFSRTADEAVRNPDLLVLDNMMDRVGDFAGFGAELSLTATTAAGTACDVRAVTLAAPD